MCGISGIVSDKPEVLSREAVVRMANAMQHRGPDDSGVYLDRTPTGGAALSHRRLTIIDLSSAGHQPMTNETGDMWLTYNGEIYNHADIRRELQALGHVYTSATDSETIIHAYEEWGDRCVERFRGMFAFALWDCKRSRLLLGRDRLGVKPLYFAKAGSTLVFASEIKAILESGVVRASVAKQHLPEYLMFGYLAGEATLFDGIEKLAPGHTLAWENGSIRIEPFWRLSPAADESMTLEDATTRFRQLFEESVRLRLMSDVPLGVFLSGGLDSSAIAAVMSRMVPGRLNTFSVGFERQHYSELPFARQVAEHIGSDHKEVILTPDAFMETLPRLVWHEDEPLWAPPSVALYHVAALASKHVKVVLTGEGSDELFGGYDRYWMSGLNARLSRPYAYVPRPVRRAIRRVAVDGVLPERIRRALSHTVLNHEKTPDESIFDNWFGVFTPAAQQRLLAPALLNQVAGADAYAAHRRIYNEPGVDVALIDRMLYTDIRTNLVELLMKQDQMSMAASIESRVPFLDHKLVEFAATVPHRLKIGRLSGKVVVKKALEGYLPDSIINRQKKGFPVPFESWLRNEFFNEASSLLLDRSADRGWFRHDALRKLLDDHRAGRANATRQVWSLMNLELWARLFLDGDRLRIERAGSMELPLQSQAGVA